LQAVHDVANLMRQTSRLQGARTLGVKAIDGARRTFPRALGAYLLRYGKPLIKAIELKEAESALLEVQEILNARFDATQHRTTGAQRALIELYAIWNEVEPDEGYEFKAAK